MSLRRVVVTGIGALTPIGNTAPEYWASLIKGVSGAERIKLFDATLFKTRFACEVKNFDAQTIFDRKEARKMDRYTHFGMAAAGEALEDSGIDLDAEDPDRFGVIWGSGIGGIKTFENEVINYHSGDGTPRFNPFFIPKMIADIASGMISIKYKLRGPNYTTVSACASSSHALLNAFNAIRYNNADMMVTGGSEAAITESGVGGFNALHALSVRNDDPKTASRPFDLDRDGFVLGEGSGVLILEEYQHAIARGAKLYAEVAGGAATADAHHITAPHPEGLGAKNVMVLALKDAGMNAEDIDYINVHGTSTPLGDISEIKAILNVFGDSSYKLNISSTKSMTGHLLGAAGAIESIAAVMSIHDDIVPPTINHFTDDPGLDKNINFTFAGAQKRTVRAALNNTFGFGGHNASVIFKKV